VRSSVTWKGLRYVRDDDDDDERDYDDDNNEIKKSE
jgi:hypothetical protein